MRKSMLAVLVLAACLGLTLASLAWAAVTKSGQAPDTVVIENSKTFRGLTKPAVRFNHASHFSAYKVGCDQCHHVYLDKKNTWKEGDKVRACAECHTSPTVNQEGGMLALMNAYHKNCRDCHKARKKGPTKCEDCHADKDREPSKKLW